MLENKQSIDPAEIMKIKCLEIGYASGVRVASHPIDQLDFVITGNPEVVIQSKRGWFRGKISKSKPQ